MTKGIITKTETEQQPKNQPTLRRFKIALHLHNNQLS